MFYRKESGSEGFIIQQSWKIMEMSTLNTDLNQNCTITSRGSGKCKENRFASVKNVKHYLLKQDMINKSRQYEQMKHGSKQQGKKAYQLKASSFEK